MLIQNIEDDLKVAFKRQELTKIKVLRLIKAELQTVQKKNPSLYTDKVENGVITKLHKMYDEVISTGKKAERPDIYVPAEDELQILLQYEQPHSSEEEIIESARSIISSRKASQGSISMKDMKPILEEVRNIYPDADGGIVSKILKEFL